ncbi:Subtilisin-like serine protease [Halalkaliarchaeum sp. AArc-CO]|uniref:S8 family serine peptidase n=1 Tax=Halalkaliarchaeum sp. AArc-CO TaxID=2866381 RepID=UPI00217DCDF7|nr:S8 family serine peptidase [Halalkaliarchaeum sp. AArc-CO]UWG51835.1 Subtilisin-like serine protease [Halalkaliarchaeum sp. AArc-CO]
MSSQTRRTFLKVSGAVLGGIATGTTVTAAERTDRFIVQTNGESLPRELEVVHEMPGVDFAVVRASASELQDARGVKDYAPDVEIRLDDPDVNQEAPTVGETSVADEPGYPLQWDKQALDVETAHETTTGEGSPVAIIDTGVAAGHPDLEVNEELSQNFTDDDFGAGVPAGGYHGTHVGGIVAAQTNGAGVAGTAPGTDLVDCRVFSPGALASFGDVLAAIVYSAAIDADAANLSLGAYPIPRQAEGQGQFYGQALNRTMTYANKEGTLLVIAAGNDSADLQHDKNFISLPNEGAQGLSVAATGPVGYGWPLVPDGDDLLVDATGTLIAGVFGPDADEFEDAEMSAAYDFDYDDEDALGVRVEGNPPYSDTGPWYRAVGFGGVTFDVSPYGAAFGDGNAVAVEYTTGPDHDRWAPDWIAYHLVDEGGDDENETHYVAVDWEVDVGSGETLSWNEDDAFGDGAGGIFEAASITEIFESDDIDPSNPSASASDVAGLPITAVGVYSGGGVGRDDGVDIAYGQISFNGNDLLLGGEFDPDSPLDAPVYTPALYTNYGTNDINLGAPGGNYDPTALALGTPGWYLDLVYNTIAEPIYETDDEGNVTGIADVVYSYGWAAGTSMAAPQVAGAAALVKSANPSYNANQVQSALERAADVPDGYDKTYYGSGFLNIVDAL